MNILVTGMSGFVGSHLAELLLRDKDTRLFDLSNVACPDGVTYPEGRVEMIEGDIADEQAVKALVERIRPDRIYHLAAQSFVPLSYSDPHLTMEINIKGTLNILEAVRKTVAECAVLICCTGEEYGAVEADDLPLKETAPFKPANPYAVSKVAQDLLGYQYYRSYGLRIIRTRAFNHTGPRQSDRFVCSSFARQVAEIKLGMRPPLIKTGNLEAGRDFSDVRDVVKAYRLLLEEGRSGEAYNVCSGQPLKIGDALQAMLEMSGVDVEVTTDPDLMRPLDVPVIYGDSSKCRQDTGWQPEIDRRRMLADLIRYWEEKLISPH